MISVFFTSNALRSFYSSQELEIYCSLDSFYPHLGLPTMTLHGDTISVCDIIGFPNTRCFTHTIAEYGNTYLKVKLLSSSFTTILSGLVRDMVFLLCSLLRRAELL